MVFLLTLTLVGAIIAGHQLGFMGRRRRMKRRTFGEVLNCLERVNFDALRLIADCYLQPDEQQLRIEPPIMWELVGGHDGLKRLRTNAELMLELAMIAAQWNKDEGPVIAEMLRRDALRIRKAVARIRRGMLWNGASVTAAFHLQEAVSSYCLMRGRLVGLYHNAHIGLLPQLEAAL